MAGLDTVRGPPRCPATCDPVPSMVLVTLSLVSSVPGAQQQLAGWRRRERRLPLPSAPPSALELEPRQWSGAPWGLRG